jgi:PIN domain
MKITERLQTVARLFLDTAPVIYYVEKNPYYLGRVQVIFEQIDAGTLTAVTSPITLAECLIAPIRLGLPLLQQDFIDLIQGCSNTVFMPFGADVARRAAAIRARYNVAALESGCESFLTDDVMFKRVTELNVLVVEEVEQA